MKKNFTYKFLISLCCLIFSANSFAKTHPIFVSLSPALTETMYVIGAENLLKGVSTSCTYPKEVKNKEKIGDSYFVNEEKILKIKPDYILAMDNSEFMLNKFKRFNITPLCFKNPDIESIYQNILLLGKLTGKYKNAQDVVNFSKNQITKAKPKKPKKILYLVQVSPMITIGEKSFITDIIEKSGHKSITENLNSFYPTISEEYAISKHPDVVVLSFYSNDTRIKKLFPKSKIIFTTPEQNDIINRPGYRIYKSVEFFANL